MLTVSFDVASIGKVVAVVIGLALAFLLLRGLSRWVRRLFAPKLQGMDRGAIKARWDEIERMAAAGGEMNLKMAVMEADKLLDHALKAMAIPGMTLGERLKFAAYKFPKIRNVWNAHRLRNQLAHESSYYLDPSFARKAVRDFKDALQLLNVL
ncbi:MAG TPA: hypothetical protein VL283_03945 [Candidatus Baltobacteraceae bacterium]|jgi:hypothetical protein|nr:hypothetical protein [Candidatus Baltobacteraceae bacterium]